MSSKWLRTSSLRISEPPQASWATVAWEVRGVCRTQRTQDRMRFKSYAHNLVLNPGVRSKRQPCTWPASQVIRGQHGSIVFLPSGLECTGGSQRAQKNLRRPRGGWLATMMGVFVPCLSQPHISTVSPSSQPESTKSHVCAKRKGPTLIHGEHIDMCGNR